MKVDGTGYRLGFRAAGRSTVDQLRIEMPTSLSANQADEALIWVNLYNGLKQSKVRARAN